VKSVNGTQAVEAVSRRGFLIGTGALALGGCASVPEGAAKAETPEQMFANRGNFERLSLSYAHIDVGATEPFSVLHITDTHLADAYPDEPVAVCGKAGARLRTFGGRQVAALESSLAWAQKNVDYVLHTGDLMDFQSRANQETVRRLLGGADIFGSMGNHEFYSYLPDMKQTYDEAFRAPSRTFLAESFPYDHRFNAQVVNGVNFVCMDDVFGTFAPDLVVRFKEEVRKGLPIVLSMHVPIYTDEIKLATCVFWKNRNKKFRGMQVIRPFGDDTRQKSDPTTVAFIQYLKELPLLKALVVGHEHITMQERFSPTAIQYVAAANFMFAGEVLLFT